MPESDPLAQEKPPSSASVFIKHRPDYDISTQTGSIKALVVNSIEGLPYDKVTVVAFPASEVLTQPQAPASSYAPQAREELSELAIGGTAVGTGINTHPKFGGLVAKRLSAGMTRLRATGQAWPGVRPASQRSAASAITWA